MAPTEAQQRQTKRMYTEENVTEIGKLVLETGPATNSSFNMSYIAHYLVWGYGLNRQLVINWLQQIAMRDSAAQNTDKIALTAVITLQSDRLYVPLQQIIDNCKTRYSHDKNVVQSIVDGNGRCAENALN